MGLRRAGIPGETSLYLPNCSRIIQIAEGQQKTTLGSDSKS